MSHQSHCCIVHGCKYGEYDTCPVCTGQVSQQYLCENCYNDLMNNGNFKVDFELLWNKVNNKVNKKFLNKNRITKLDKIKSNA